MHILDQSSYDLKSGSSSTNSTIWRDFAVKLIKLNKAIHLGSQLTYLKFRNEKHALR